MPCQNKEKKGQHQKVTFLGRNVKEYRVLFVFGTRLGKKIKIPKKGQFSKIAY